ncbi:EAL domain-containing protein [Mitsuaria sp. WAJ17]|uniref:putative bifunctional diguanylate cyclase/phosphodiesterase n=1 Tax=Mitsuaria sp. WAJ17 TaxID=2761452 RepID=UPI0016001C24|nr:GGDEF and EAL domain-containing protein [Mitsuaria sp. WAJ17]MBB2486664.1 EAL domain-containing protein [Mitsuaria sp. WAJ17]
MAEGDTALDELQRALRGALEEAQMLRLLADNVPVLMALYEARTFHCRFANLAYARTFGHSTQSVLGRTFAEVIGEEAARQIQPYVDQVMQRGEAVRYERQMQAPDGRPRWLEVNLLPQFAPGQGPGSPIIGAFVLINDISERRCAEAAMRESEARLDKFMQATVEGILFHKGGIITDANPPLCELVGYRLDELVGQPALDFVAPDMRPKVSSVMMAGQELRYESAILHRSGERIPVEFIVRTLERQGERLRMTIIRDIREQLATQARIHHLAHHDPLTQLLNRAAFMERMQARLDDAHVPQRSLALLFIDLDNFKRVNDSLGHLEGDKVLGTVADRVSACLRSTDLVGRFGGDEFVVLLADVRSRADVQAVLSALLAVVEVPVQADGRDLSVTPSIGVAMYPEHGSSAEELIQHADAAMYLAKASGRANYRFFEPELAERAYADLVLEAELALALTRDEFQLFYQPQVDARTGQLRGAEALLRWRHPQRGLLTPEAFIDVAERHRLMLPLSEWVMREAARQSRDWHERGVAAVPIAVNLSSMQFRLEDFDRVVALVLQDAGVPGTWLELELTERMLMDDIERVPALLQALRAQGLSISVDDFGTGYTSLSHLGRLPVDKLKIDQSFVAGLPGDGKAEAITRAIVQMGLGLGLQVSAEGVRDPAQARLLGDWGCHSLQGELIGPPMPATDFERWLGLRRAAP